MTTEIFISTERSNYFCKVIIEYMNPEEYKTEYKEVNVTNYIKVFRKRKRLILGLFLIAVIGAGVYSFFIAQKVYKIETSLEIGTVGSQAADGLGQIIEEPIQVAKKIENDVYGALIREKGEMSEGGYPKIKVKNPEKTNLITIEAKSSQPQQAKNILEEMNNLILEEHQGKIKIKKESLENDISLLENNISLLENSMGILRKDIERIKTKITSLEEEKKNLEAKISALQQVLPYQQDPGTQFALFSAKGELEKKKQEIENLYLGINALEGGAGTGTGTETGIGTGGRGINSLQNQINSLQNQINSLRRQIDDIRNTRIIKAPAISGSSVSPKPSLNIVIAGVLGIFLGMFLALGKEWWEKSKI